MSSLQDCDVTAEIINLRRARKAKARADAQVRAAENRAKHGRPKAERNTAKREASLAARKLEAHRREVDDDEPAP